MALGAYSEQNVLKHSFFENKIKTLLFLVCLGQRVASLVENDSHRRGMFDVSFGNTTLPAGVCYYALKTDTNVQTKKVVFMR